MASRNAATPQEQGVAFLNNLMEVMKNPDKVKEYSKEMIKANEISEEKRQEAEDAQKAIQAAADAQADLVKKKAELVQFENDLNSKEVKLKSQSERIDDARKDNEEFNEELNKRKIELLKSNETNLLKQKELDAREYKIEETEKELRSRQDAIEAREAKLRSALE